MKKSELTEATSNLIHEFVETSVMEALDAVNAAAQNWKDRVQPQVTEAALSEIAGEEVHIH